MTPPTYPVSHHASTAYACVAAPTAASGHVAAWVGVNRPGGVDRYTWLQAGAAAVGGRVILYVERMEDGTRTVKILASSATSECARVSTSHLGPSWTLYVNGSPVGTMRLPGAQSLAVVERYGQERATASVEP